MDGTAGAVVFLTGYLIVASFFVALVIEETEGYEIETLNLGGYSITTNEETDFTLYTNISELNMIIVDGGWNLSSINGLYSTRIGRNALFFLNTEHEEGWYNNTYHFKNPNGREHGIYIYSQHLLNNIHIEVLNDGFMFKDGFTERFYNYPGADEIPEYNFTTNFDTTNEWCTVFFEDIEIFNRPASISLFTGIWSYLGETNYYSGIYVFGEGFEIHDLSSLYSLSVEESDFSISSMLKSMATIIFWLPPSNIMPLVLNIFLIKLPGFGLAFIVVQTIRGTG